MLFRSKIKWIALFVLVLSLASLLLHLSIAKSSSVSLVYNTQMASLLNSSIIGGQVDISCLLQLFSLNIVCGHVLSLICLNCHRVIGARSCGEL